MEFSKNIERGMLSVVLSGRCTFIDQQYVQQIENDLEANELSNIQMDLTNLNFIDSSSLGMLIALQNKAKTKNIDISLLHPTGQVKRVLNITKLDKIFTIID